MKYLNYGLLALVISSCGLPNRPHLSRRDSDSAVPMAEPAPAADAEAVDRPQEEDVAVLNQTMKERYLSARGIDLRTGRTALASGMENATLRPFQSLIDKLALAFGKTAADIPLTDASSFTISKPLQNDGPNYGASAYRLFANAAVTLCKGMIAANTAKFTALPTQDGLAKQCNEWGERFWFRSMTPAEMQICLNTGLEVTKATTNAAERWGQICAVVATAPQFVIVDAPQIATPSTGTSTTPSTTTTTNANVPGNADTGRQLFTMSCSGCHGGNRPIKARTDVALQAASINPNHSGREGYFLPAKNTTTASEYNHILAYLKSL